MRSRLLFSGDHFSEINDFFRLGFLWDLRLLSVDDASISVRCWRDMVKFLRFVKLGSVIGLGGWAYFNEILLPSRAISSFCLSPIL